jgi:hypothetical protein
MVLILNKSQRDLCCMIHNMKELHRFGPGGGCLRNRTNRAAQGYLNGSFAIEIQETRKIRTLKRELFYRLVRQQIISCEPTEVQCQIPI